MAKKVSASPGIILMHCDALPQLNHWTQAA